METQNTILNYYHINNTVINKINNLFIIIKRNIKQTYERLEKLGSAAGYAIRR